MSALKLFSHKSSNESFHSFGAWSNKMEACSCKDFKNNMNAPLQKALKIGGGGGCEKQFERFFETIDGVLASTFSVTASSFDAHT